MPDIILATLNARYSHASLGLRCLRANLGALRERSSIREFTIGDQPARIAEQLLAEAPRIIGFGVYIWNLRETERVVAILKTVQPDLRIIMGGPEVSFGVEHTRLGDLVDVVIRGEGDIAFADVCQRLLAGEDVPRSIDGGKPSVDQLTLPYDEYTDEDLRQRIIYVEASRGCPFTCEFCLSSIDDGVRAFALDNFLAAMGRLVDRGCRTFKFVDRTFNLKPSSCERILTFFLDRWPRAEDGSLLAPLTARQMDQGSARNEAFFLHFEMVPDRLPEGIRALITRFPAGAIQFEIGIQSFTPEVGVNISRRMDTTRTEANLTWLRELGSVHVHADLIIGLPGETLATFLASYDQLWRLRPGEIQVGILKLLRGTPLARHVTPFSMAFNPEPPYDLLASAAFPFATMQRCKRFARYHELFVNSGRFPRSIDLIVASAPTDSPGTALLAFSDWLWAQTGQDHALALPRQYDLVLDHLFSLGVAEDAANAVVLADFLASGNIRHAPARLRAAAEAARPHPGSRRAALSLRP